MPPRRRAAQVLHRHELVEDAVVEHEGEAARGLRLHAHEPFRGRVDLDAGEAPPEPLLEHVGVGREGHPAVNQHVQVRPELPEAPEPAAAVGPRVARDPLEQDDEPGRQAREQPDVLRATPPPRWRSRRSSQPAITAHSGPGEYRPRNPQGRRLATSPDRSPTSVPSPRGRRTVLPPRNSIGPPISARSATRQARGAEQRVPPAFLVGDERLRRYRDHLVARVVPEVFTQSRHRPGHATDSSPAAARASHGRSCA